MARWPISRVVSEPLCYSVASPDDDDHAGFNDASQWHMPRRRSEDSFLGRRQSVPARRARSDGEGSVDTYFQRWQSDPGYVSLDKIINSPEFRQGSVRPPEFGIRDPLVRTASRAYMQPRHRSKSPAPYGLRRGSPVHLFFDGVLLNQVVNPCLSFIGSVFRRSPKAPPPPPCSCMPLINDQ